MPNTAWYGWMSKTIKTNINSVEWYVRRQEFTHARMHETIAPLNPCTNCEAAKCMEHATYLVSAATMGPGACSALLSEAPATPTLPAAPSRWYTQRGPCAKPGSSGCSVTAASGDSVPQNDKHITVPRGGTYKTKSGTDMEGRVVAVESRCTDVQLRTGG